MKKRNRIQNNIKSLFFALVLLTLCACSDEGKVQYADDAFLRELCGLPAETTEAENPEQTTESQEDGQNGEAWYGKGTEGQTKGGEDTEGQTEGWDGTEGQTEDGQGGEETEGKTEMIAQDGEGQTGESQDGNDQDREGQTGEDQDGNDQDGEAQDEEDLANKKMLWGSWKSEPISVQEMVMDALTDVSWLEPYLQFEESKLTVCTTFMFFEDGSAKMIVDEDSYHELMGYVTQEVANGASLYFDSYVQRLGGHLSTKQYLKLMGISLEDTVSSIIEEYGGRFDETEMSYQCLFDLRGDRIYIGETKEALEKGEDYLIISMTEEQLTFMQYYENGKHVSDPFDMDVTLPMILTRIP